MTVRASTGGIAEGAVFVVTGCERGIGRATVAAISAAGGVPISWGLEGVGMPGAVTTAQGPDEHGLGGSMLAADVGATGLATRRWNDG
jgi:NAD(P)-dependent dehydrogenase (short-subunit alcohol dehydrogenase family)